ncbi:MAG: hypothetical protein CMM77_03380 [Rhodospirillaceae bacterium]|nr:hypothetical protein [Rhodospirillaceae bacterium]
MSRVSRIGGLVALTALVVAAGLWWESGAWQYGDLSTRGLVRVAGFSLVALACHGLAALLRRRAR